MATIEELKEVIKEALRESTDEMKAYIDKLDAAQRADWAKIVTEWNEKQEATMERFFLCLVTHVPQAITGPTSLKNRMQRYATTYQNTTANTAMPH